MAVTGRVENKKRLDMQKIYSGIVAVRDKKTGYHINKDAIVDVYYKGECVNSIKVVIVDNRPYFYVDKDEYLDFEEAYKNAMIQAGCPVYYKKVM